MSDAPATAHRRLKASAGSGKTYRLVLRAIELLHADAAVDDLLAATFTRNAAGEIRDRILGRLCEAASDDAAAATLDDDLRSHRTLPWANPAAMTRLRAGTILVTLAREVHRLQVRTLDGLFAAIVSAFPIETGTAPGSRIVDEAEERRLREDAIELLLADPEHGDAVVRLLRTLTQGRSDSGVDRLIDATVGAAWAAWRESDADAWRCMAVPPRPEDAAMSAALADIAAVRAAGSYAQKNLDGWLARIPALVAAEDWACLAREGPVSKVANGSHSFGNTALGDDLLDPFGVVVDRVRHERRRTHAERTEAMAELCARFGAYLEHLKRERGRLGFEDLPARLIAASGVTGDFDRLAWRLDARLEHMLLDEFQDTSVRQWDVLEPMARRVVEDLSDQRTLFVVGDVKQSIYGWRSGRPEILEHLPVALLGDAAHHVEDEPLHVSWRSSPVVLNAVNHLFGSLGTNPAVVEEPAVAAAAVQFASPWTPHLASDPNLGLAGFVELATGRDHPDVPAQSRGSRNREGAVRTAVAKVIRWHREVPTASIGVLVRTRAAAERVLESLRRANPSVPAVGPGGRPLVDEPAVTAVLSLLWLADHPGDRAAAFHVAAGPLGPIVGLDRRLAEDSRAFRGAAEGLSARVRDRLARDGLTATIGDWVRRLAPACDGGQVRRLQHLRELASEREAELGPRPSEFVAVARSVRVAEPAPGTVSVLTVHASKGLEFDLVVMTDLGGTLARAGSLVVDRHPADGRVSRVRTRVPAKEGWILDAAESAADDRVETADVRESLCLLYVAMTRARQGLSMIIPAPTINKTGSERFPSSRFHGLLRGGFTDGEPPEPECTIWSLGDEPAMLASLQEQEGGGGGTSGDARGAGSSDGSATAVCRLRPAAPRRPRPISAAAAAATAEATAPLARRLAPAPREPRDRGTALHALLEAIRWLDEPPGTPCAAGVPSPEAAVRLVRRAVPRRPAAWAAAQAEELGDILRHEAIAALLRLDGRDPALVRVDNERPWVRADARGVQRGFIDRVEIERDPSGGISRVRIIDWKTDAFAPEADAEERARTVLRYAPQIQAYRSVMSAATGVPEDAIEAVLAFLASGVVLPVPAGEPPGTPSAVPDGDGSPAPA